MTKGLSIPIASDTKAALQGIKTGLIDPLQDAQDALDKLGKGSNLDSITSDMKAAQKATEQENKALQETVQYIKNTAKQSRTSTKEVSDDFELSAREQTHLRKEAIKEIGNEAKANAAETFSSFDGSAQSFVDGIQGTLGGLVSSLGPIGLAAGAAGALAIGLINGALQNADTTSAEFKQGVADLTSELIKTGQVGQVSVGYVVAALQKLATETDGSKVSLTKLSDAAHKSDTSFKSLAQAYAGNEKGLHNLVEAGKDKLYQDQLQADANSRLSTDQAKAEQGDATAYANALRKAEAQKDVNKYLEQAADKADKAAAQEKLYVAAGGPELEAKAAQVDQINQAYDDAAGSVEDYIDKESGVLDVSKYIAAMQAKQKALQDYQTDLASSGLSPQAKQFLAAQGEDAAATLLAGYKSGSVVQQSALAQIWNEAGSTSSGAYTKSLINGLPSTLPGPLVKPQVEVDVAAANAKLKQIGRGLTVQVDGITLPGGKRIL